MFITHSIPINTKKLIDKLDFILFINLDAFFPIFLINRPKLIDFVKKPYINMTYLELVNHYLINKQKLS